MTRVYLQMALLVLCLWAAVDCASVSSEVEPQSPDSAFQDFNRYKVVAKNDYVEHRRIEPAILVSKRLSNGDKQSDSKDAFDSISKSLWTLDLSGVNSECNFPFYYQEKWYQSCSMVNSARPWCSLDVRYKSRWIYCELTKKIVTGINAGNYGTVTGRCALPWYTVGLFWKKTWHNKCVVRYSRYKLYCSYLDHQKSQYHNKECNYVGMTVRTLRGNKCIFPFEYAGVKYYACTGRKSPDDEYGRLWCKTMGYFSWDYCEEVSNGQPYDEVEMIANATQAEPKIPTTYLMPKQSEDSTIERERLLEQFGNDIDVADLPAGDICAKILQGDIKDYEKDALRLQNEGVDFIQKCKAANYPENPEGKINLVKVPSPSGEQRNELWYM